MRETAIRRVAKIEKDDAAPGRFEVEARVDSVTYWEHDKEPSER